MTILSWATVFAFIGGVAADISEIKKALKKDGKE